eukprot:814502-Rhodomonas_salina.1
MVASTLDAMAAPGAAGTTPRSILLYNPMASYAMSGSHIRHACCRNEKKKEKKAPGTERGYVPDRKALRGTERVHLYISGAGG